MHGRRTATDFNAQHVRIALNALLLLFIVRKGTSAHPLVLVSPQLQGLLRRS